MKRIHFISKGTDFEDASPCGMEAEKVKDENRSNNLKEVNCKRCLNALARKDSGKKKRTRKTKKRREKKMSKTISGDVFSALFGIEKVTGTEVLEALAKMDKAIIGPIAIQIIQNRATE